MKCESTRTIGKTYAIALALATGCNSGEVESPPVAGETDPDHGYGDTGDTGDTDTAGANPDECWITNAPAGAVRWQCEGLAEAAIFGTVHVEIPEDQENGELFQAIIDGGRIDVHELFGPWNNESYDEPGVDACCLPDIGGNDDEEGEGEDETGADSTAGMEDEIPQAAEACTDDCIDQACRQFPRTLRDLADELPAGIPIAGPSYRKQLRDLANWIATNHHDCYNALRADGIDAELGGYEVSGEWHLPDRDDWPDVTDLSVSGQCKVYDWYLPEQGEPQACMGINDNNEEEPFGSGSSLGGFDTLVTTGGSMELEGPTIFGVDVAGTASILGLGNDCPRGECSRVDAWLSPEGLEFQRILLVAPPAMTWERDGMRLTVEGLHAMLEHPRLVPLVDEGGVMRFEIPAGELELLFAGRVHGVPVKVNVPNASPITGSVMPLVDGSYALTIAPFDIEHQDGYGTWTMHMSLGEFVAVEHSPRAWFFEQPLDSGTSYDASTSFDPDGDPLSFEWYVDGKLVGEGPTLIPEPVTGPSTLALRVSDPMGRASWSYGMLLESE